MPHRRSRRTAQSYSQVAPMCPPIRVHWRHDWTWASFRPPESTTKTANRSVQPFLHSLPQSVVWHIGATWRIRLTINNIIDWTCVLPLAHQSLQPKRQNRSVQPFLQSSQQKVPILYLGANFPKNCHFPWGSRPLSSTWFLGPIRVLNSTQTASWSVQPFLKGSLVWQTDRPTDDATRSATIGRIYTVRT